MTIPRDDAPFGVVGVGASAGGVEALKLFVSGLPSDLNQAIFVVLHLAPSAPSVLGQILDRHGPLPAVAARDGDVIRAGRIYVAVPDRHLLVDGGRIVLSSGPVEDRHRPAINPLLRSLAVAHGPRATGVLLSGVLDDGVLGLAAVSSRGGVTVVQDPDEALYPDMALHALATVHVDHTVAAADVGRVLGAQDRARRRPAPHPPNRVLELENTIAMGPPFGEFDVATLGSPSGYTCPDCGGTLIAVGDGNLRCRVGHAWTPEALLAAWTSDTENALGIALRTFLEKAQLARAHASAIRDGELRRRYVLVADEAEGASAELRKLLGAATRTWGDSHRAR